MNNSKKIAIIGASYLQLPLVLKANDLGYESYCFAITEGAVCKEHCTSFYPISILEKEEILAICKEIRIDAVLSIASDLAVGTVNYIASELGLIANPESSTSITTHKFFMKVALQKEGVNVAQFTRCKNPQDLEKATLFRYPIIVKPVDRSGSLGVSKIESISELKNAFETAKNSSISGEVILEEFIIGTEISVESISQNGVHHILAFTDKVTTGAPHFVELEHHQPSTLLQTTQDEIKNLITKALTVLSIENGAAHSELIITSNNEIFINEIGARMGGDFIGSNLVQLSTGFDYLKAVLDVSLGNPIILKFSSLKYSGVVFRNTMNEAKFDQVSRKEPYIITLESNLKNALKLTKSNERGNYFIYQSDKRINLD